jgi:hypothetical protein
VNPEPDIRLLTRAKWVGVLLPIAFIWGFEIVRSKVVEPSVSADSAHDFAALVMSGKKTLKDLGFTKEVPVRHYAVKEAVLPFTRTSDCAR